MAMYRMGSNLAAADEKRQVIAIEATERTAVAKLRLAAYARVSSPSEDQLNSFAAQESYYRNLISNNEEWELVEIYADEGITGTAMLKREDFLRMLSDCRKGKIDRILVKSVSRFARNTKECLAVVRELKALGVSVYFEEQRIDTGIATGEMLTTMFASIAQAESESHSKNMRWSYKHRMERGEFVTCKAPFGYRLKNGSLEVDEEEAKVVREIFTRYLQGESGEEITAWINDSGLKSRDGNDVWHTSAIRYILKNEKYIGNAMLQKTYSTDSFPYKKVKNKGDKAKYYVEETQEAIIDPVEFEAVQNLLSQRGTKITRVHQQMNCLSGKIECGNCGQLFKRKKHVNSAYWVCRTHDQDKEKCKTKQLPEDEIHKAFLRLYYKLKRSNMDAVRKLLQTLETIQEKRFLWSPQMIELNNQISEIQSQNHTLTMLKQQGLVDSGIYISQSNVLAEQLWDLKKQKEQLMNVDGDETIEETKAVLQVMSEGPDFLESFDPELFSELVDKIIVEDDEHIRFHLRNGMEAREKIERKKR